MIAAVGRPTWTTVALTNQVDGCVRDTIRLLCHSKAAASSGEREIQRANSFQSPSRKLSALIDVTAMLLSGRVNRNHRINQARTAVSRWVE